MKLPILYKLSATGKISEWEIESIQDDPCYYVITHGYQSGSKQEQVIEITSGKNIGRANETTTWEQCKDEALSRWTKQRDRKGYSETIPTSKPLRPMLAKSYNYPGKDITKIKDGKHIKFPCYWQPKLDGMRCLAIKKGKAVVLLSRQGKQLKVLQHIVDELEKIMDDSTILDGELYNHQEDFQKIISAAKRDSKSADTSCIQYHVYDCISTDSFDKRFKYIFSLLIKNKQPVSDVVRLVWTQVIKSADDLINIHDEQIRRGYEGVILRNKDGLYEIDKRSKDLQKVKAFCEEEFEIVGAYENLKKLGTCTFQCKTNKGAIFGCMPEGSEEYRQRCWSDWQSGKIVPGDLLTVQFFSWTTSDKPVPRFPVGKAIRNYE